MNELKYWAAAIVIVFAFLSFMSIVDGFIKSHGEEVSLIKSDEKETLIKSVPWSRLASDLTLESDEISIYPQRYQCDYKNKAGIKCDWINMPYITYKVNYDTQSVIYWSSDKTLYKAENCIVRDKKNWHCSKSFRFGFIAGEFMSTVSENYRYVSKTDYWLRYFDNKHVVEGDSVPEGAKVIAPSLETAPESVKSKLPQKRTFAGQFRQKSTGKLVNTFSNGDQEYTDKIVGPGSKEFPR